MKFKEGDEVISIYQSEQRPPAVWIIKYPSELAGFYHVEGKRNHPDPDNLHPPVRAELAGDKLIPRADWEREEQARLEKDRTRETSPTGSLKTASRLAILTKQEVRNFEYQRREKVTRNSIKMGVSKKLLA